MELASVIADVTASLIGLAMLSLAVRGLTIWRVEKRTIWRAEAARNLLRSLYRYRSSVRRHKYGAPWGVHYATQYPRSVFEASGTTFPHQNIRQLAEDTRSRETEVEEALIEMEILEGATWTSNLRTELKTIASNLEDALSGFIGEAQDALKSPEQYMGRYTYLFTHGEEPPGGHPPSVESLHRSIELCEECVGRHENIVREIMRMKITDDLLPPWARPGTPNRMM